MRTEAAYGHIFVACVGFVGCIAFPPWAFCPVVQTLSKPFCSAIVPLHHDAASWLPLMGTLLVVRAFDRAAGVIQQAVKKLNADAEQDWRRGVARAHYLYMDQGWAGVTSTQ